MAQDWDPKQWQLTKTSESTNSNAESHSSGYDGFYEDYGVSHSPDPKRFRTTSPSSSEIPTLEEQSWPDLWSQMLHTDLSADVVLNADADSNAFAEDGSNTCLLAVENDIETWAEANWVSASSSQDMDIEQTGNAFQSVLQTSNRAEVKPVCFGMIHSVPIQLIGDMLPLQKKLESQPRSRGRCGFQVMKGEKYYAIQFSDGVDFGMVNAQTARALDNVVSQPSVYLEAFALAEQCQRVLRRARKPSEATLTVDIYVCGSIDAKQIVGDRLSAAKVYLQHIEHHAEKYHYDNPHYISFPGIDADAIPETTFNSSHPGRVPAAQKVRNIFAQVCDSLQRDRSLQTVEKDIRIRTALLNHQQKALDFMYEREYGPVPSGFGLWDFNVSGGEVGYKHSITGAILSTQPSETGGGILADEMGMGKSLMVIAHIARTLDRSHTWARMGNSQDVELPNEAISSRSTLIVVPSTLVLNEWLLEINKHVDGSLEVIKYHGHRREVRPAKLADTDIILTTYHTLAADVASKKNTLHQIRWYRVVLDEAHIVRRQSTKLYAAVALLAAELRWCLTATPIHNSLEDIGSLIALVGVFPLDNPLLFRKHIVLPFERDEHTVRDKLQRILDSLCLRRKASLLDLPELVEIRRELCLTAKEKQQYERTSSLMDLAIKQRANDASGKLNPFGLFQAQLQLRILCNHGTFQKQFSWGQARDFLLEREDAVALLGQNSEIKCSLCKEIIPILSITRPLTDLQHCGHIFCPECVLQQPGPRCGNGFLTQCQLCQKADIESARSDGNKPRSFTSKTAFAQQDDNYFNDNGFSTKIAAIMADLEEDQFKSKSIIFSCWTRTLNLISRHLRCRGVHFSRIDGNCELNRRQEMIRSFSTENDVPVLIMTTGTGAFGLNLAVASRIFIVEPQWNPSVESQAIGRACRIGQKVPVTVFRYFIRGTVEEEMRAQQGRKVNLAKVGWQQA